MKPAILLDRDGTIIVDKNYLNTPDEVEFLPQAIDGLKAFVKKGFLLVVVSNQSGVARGIVQEDNIHKIHKKMDKLLEPHGVKISAYYYCGAASDSNDPNRKPNPGMLHQAIKDLNLDPNNTWMIGDRTSDIEAGQNAHLKTIYIQNQIHPLEQTATTSTSTKTTLPSTPTNTKNSSTSTATPSSSSPSSSSTLSSSSTHPTHIVLNLMEAYTKICPQSLP
jgi:D-glycero-D-manno-heptose 1,7-bisphosphate phosphatase